MSICSHFDGISKSHAQQAAIGHEVGRSVDAHQTWGQGVTVAVVVGHSHTHTPLALASICHFVGAQQERHNNVCLAVGHVCAQPDVFASIEHLFRNCTGFVDFISLLCGIPLSARHGVEIPHLVFVQSECAALHPYEGVFARGFHLGGFSTHQVPSVIGRYIHFRPILVAQDEKYF